MRIDQSQRNVDSVLNETPISCKYRAGDNINACASISHKETLIQLLMDANQLQRNHRFRAGEN